MSTACSFRNEINILIYMARYTAFILLPASPTCLRIQDGPIPKKNFFKWPPQRCIYVNLNVDHCDWIVVIQSPNVSTDLGVVFPVPQRKLNDLTCQQYRENTPPLPNNRNQRMTYGAVTRLLSKFYLETGSSKYWLYCLSMFLNFFR